MPRLPLFPLGTVLLPGARLPLQVFEPRYLRLLDDLLSKPPQERCFGVVAIRRGHEVGPRTPLELHDVGCEARLDALVRDPSAGRLLVRVVATGTRPFRLELVDDVVDPPYLTAVVRWAPPAALTEATAALAEQVRAGLTAYLTAVGRPPDPLEVHPHQVPYAAAEAMALELRDRQAVLEAATHDDRLRVVLGLLRRERGLVERFHAVPPPLLPDTAGLN